MRSGRGRCVSREPTQHQQQAWPAIRAPGPTLPWRHVRVPATVGLDPPLPPYPVLLAPAGSEQPREFVFLGEHEKALWCYQAALEIRHTRAHQIHPRPPPSQVQNQLCYCTLQYCTILFTGRALAAQPPVGGWKLQRWQGDWEGTVSST